MNKRNLGMLLSSLGAIIGIVGTWVLFIIFYEPYQVALLAGSGCDAIIIGFFPIMADFGIIAGVLYLLSAIGFYSEKNWAFYLAAIANVLALQGAFWAMIPAMSVGLPPSFILVFLPNLIIYFPLLVKVGEINWSRVILALIAGMAFVMSFMNGIAGTNRILGTISDPVRVASGAPIYVVTQRMNWVASFGFGILTAGIILHPKTTWLRFVGIAAALAALVAMPLAILNTMDKGSFSMFFSAPLLSIPIFVVCLWTGLWERLVSSKPNQF